MGCLQKSYVEDMRSIAKWNVFLHLFFMERRGICPIADGI